MIVAIADTHATVWYLFSDPRLGKTASAFIDDTMLKGDHIGVSTISIVEMVYLIENDRIPPTALDDLRAASIVLPAFARASRDLRARAILKALAILIHTAYTPNQE